MKPRVPAPAVIAEDEAALFRREMQGVRPAPPPNRADLRPAPPPPVPVQRIEDERQVILELAHLAGSPDDVEIEDDHCYLRPGLARDVLRKLRRAHWILQAELDLHGLTGDEAAAATLAFLAESARKGLRCLRIIHGQGHGSYKREPVLKGRVRKLLARHPSVLAFAEPPPVRGGAGAVVVLLEARKGP